MKIDTNSYSTYNMELQISYSLCTKVQETSNLRKDKSGDRAETKKVMRMERSRNNRSRSLPGPNTSFSIDTAKDKCIKFYGIS